LVTEECDVRGFTVGRRPGQGRRQFFHDPAAPAPEGLLPTAYAAVRNSEGRVLLVRRADDGNWELPGGRVDIGESASEAVAREVAEEAGVAIRVTGVVGVYSDPGHVLAYPHGEVRQQFAVCFHAWAAGSDVHPDLLETSAAGWFDPGEVSQLAMHPTTRQRLDHALTAPDHVHFD
jgi:ADP-ribose pyrophosphatase YjhB (NUDIX family)